METIITFLSTSQTVIFLVPVILILLVLLVVLNKSHKVEVVAQVAIPPVTTTPAKVEGEEVVSQVIPTAVASVLVENHPQGEAVQPVVAMPIVETGAIKETIASVEAPAPAPAPAPIPVVESPVILPVEVSAPAPAPVATPSWRPAEPVIVTSEVVAEAEVVTPVEAQALSEIVEPMPAIVEAVPVEAVVTEVINPTPVVAEVETQATKEGVVEAPLVHPTV